MTEEPQPTSAPLESPPSAPLESPPPPPAAAPPQASRRRTYIVIAVIVVFLGIVLFAVRDNQSAKDLAIGTCFDRPSGSTITTVVKHACTEAHDAEVFHVAEYTGGFVPGQRGVRRLHRRRVQPRFRELRRRIRRRERGPDVTAGTPRPRRAGTTTRTSHVLRRAQGRGKAHPIGEEFRRILRRDRNPPACEGRRRSVS